MPSIKISNGVVKYKTHPLFLGIKVMDKDKSTENLIGFKSFLDKYDITFGLIAGTLLGAVREQDFISHDEDIDLYILEEQRESFLDLLPELKKFGFEVARYDRRGLLSIIKNGEYIDIYFFKKLCKDIRHCCGWFVPEMLLTEMTTIKFKGLDFNVPKDYEGFLVYEYGEDWKTPIKWANYEMPAWKRKIHEWKELTKEILPDFIFYMIANKAERKVIEKYKKNLDRYNKLRNTSLVISI